MSCCRPQEPPGSPSPPCRRGQRSTDWGVESGRTWSIGRAALAMFLDGAIKALGAYHAGDRSSEIVARYFVRLNPAQPRSSTSLDLSESGTILVDGVSREWFRNVRHLPGLSLRESRNTLGPWISLRLRTSRSSAGSWDQCAFRSLWRLAQQRARRSAYPSTRRAAGLESWTDRFRQAAGSLPIG